MSFSMARDEQGCNGELQGRIDPPKRQRSYLVSKYGLNLFCALLEPLLSSIVLKNDTCEC